MGYNRPDYVNEVHVGNVLECVISVLNSGPNIPHPHRFFMKLIYLPLDDGD